MALGAVPQMPVDTVDAHALQAGLAAGVRAVILDPHAAFEASVSELISALATLTTILAEPGEPSTDCAVFVTVRSAREVTILAELPTPLREIVTGIVVPDFDTATGAGIAAALTESNVHRNSPMAMMPTIQAPNHPGSRASRREMGEVADLLLRYRHLVLGVRLDISEVCAARGISRMRDIGLYDLPLVADGAAEVMNVFARTDHDCGVIVTGASWSAPAAHMRMMPPALRATPFSGHGGRWTFPIGCSRIVSGAADRRRARVSRPRNHS